MSAWAMVEEAERLERWKSEATIVINGWEAVWEAAGRPGGLGSLKYVATREHIEQQAEEIRNLQAEKADLLHIRDDLQAEKADLLHIRDDLQAQLINARARIALLQSSVEEHQLRAVSDVEVAHARKWPIRRYRQ